MAAKRKIVTLFVLACLWPYALLAQQIHPTAKGWQELTISDGLSQGMIYDLVQDRKGFIWIATKDGLNRYDGHNFKVFTHDPYNDFSLSDNACSALLIDRRGRLWVGTINKGLNLYDERSGRFFHIAITDPALANANNYEVRLLAEDPDGNIWVSTNAGRPFKIQLPPLLRQDFPKQVDFTKQVAIIPLQVANEQPNHPDAHFSFRASGQGITGQEDGMYQFNWRNPKTLSRYNLITGPTPALFDFYEDIQKGYQFVSTSRQLWAWHRGSLRRIGLAGTDGMGVAIHPLDNNRLLLSTGTFLWLMTPAELFGQDSLNARNAFVAIPNDGFAITKILRDKTGNIWVGTNGYGLRKFNPRVKQFAEYLPRTSLTNLYMDRQGRLYGRIQLAYSQIDRANNRVMPFLNPNLPPPDQRQRNLMQDSRGFFWVSNVNFETHENQLFKFSTDWQLLKKCPLPAGITFGFVGNQTIEDKAGNLWIGAINGKLLHFNLQTERFQVHSYQALLPQSGADVDTHALLPEADSVLWIGTPQGLIKARKTPTALRFSIYKNSIINRQSLSNNLVLSLAHDPYQPDRYLWIGTKGGGLERLDKQMGHFNHFTEAQGLPNKVVYGILTDENKNLWLSTNRGLAQFNPRTFLFRNYTKADGLQDDEFNTLSFLKAPSGELLFGGVNGLTVFQASDLAQSDQKKPKVNIIGLKVNNKPVEVGGPEGILSEGIEYTSALNLAHDQNLLTFEFGVIDYTNSANNRYRYRLDDIDQDWVEAGTNRFANYAQLPPGSYRLQMMGSVDGEHWSKPVTLAVRVHPPFYRTWWAYLLYLLMAAGLVWQFTRAQSQRLLLHQQVAFEQKEANRLVELDALKTQFFTNITHAHPQSTVRPQEAISNRNHLGPDGA